MNNEGVVDPSAIVSPEYEILAELGRGTTGVVYKARCVALDRLVALKILLPASAAECPLQLTRFRREAEVLANLTNDPDPDFPTLYEVGEYQGHLYLVRDFVDGATLEQLVTVGAINLRVGVNLLMAVARAIHRVHCHGVAHRNLQPSNVLVTADNTAKLIGFGSVGLLTRSPTAPAGAPASSADTDLQAIGRMLGWLCLGLRQPMPARLETICCRCSTTGSAGGYANAADLADDLADYLAEEHPA